MKRKLWIISAVVLILLAALYLLFTFSQIPFIANLRQIYVETAMGTMNHQWLATALLPDSVVDKAMAAQKQARKSQEGIRSAWESGCSFLFSPVTDRESFYSVFHELIPDVTDQWLSAHPDVQRLGWSHLTIKPGEADGLTTKLGETVIALDVPNGILIVEVETANTRGVLAIAKDPTAISVCPSENIGSSGDTVGSIAYQNNAVLGITGSAFHYANENAGGGDLAGFAVCSGIIYGAEGLPEGNKRAELRENNLLYIVDSTDPLDDACTDAVEFRPALIVDGTVLVEEGWAGLQPRTCLGQSEHGEILMLVMEGRILSEGNLGASVLECARILKRHSCMQAINLDGGNSAMLWYDGDYLTKCCDTTHPKGRPVPTAVIYKSKN